MGRPVGRSIFWGGLVALLIVGSGLPSQAAYTKLYSFPNATGVNQTSVKATLGSLKSIIASTSTPSTWSAPPKPTVSSTVVSGVYCTTLTFGTTPAVANGTSVTVGWTTSDNSCRLRDLRWGGGQVPVPTQLGGVPGGGAFVYDPESGDLTVIITNDNLKSSQYLSLSDVGFTVGPSLDFPDLAPLAAPAPPSVVDGRVDAIIADLQALQADVEAYAASGATGPDAESLLGKIDDAITYLKNGQTAYDAIPSRRAQALALWGKAAQRLATFISEVKGSANGNLDPLYASQWLGYFATSGIAPASREGDGELPATAPQIRDDIAALPSSPWLLIQSLDPLPPGTSLPITDTGTEGHPDPLTGYRQWPLDILKPGQCTAFVVHGVYPGDGFAMYGSVFDGDDVDRLDWAEQETVPYPPDVVWEGNTTPPS
jgi:hypothetical protein